MNDELLIGLVSISDRASQGVYEDQGIPALKDWFDRIEARPAVQRGVQVLTELRKPAMDAQAREVLFGQTQFKAR